MKKILVVDDEMEFVNDFAKGLAMFGYEVFKAGDSEGALNIIESKMPDIVLCDYRLPDMDGDKLLEKIKTGYPVIKVIMVTAYYDEVVEKRFMNLGADKVIFKPINLNEIEKLLEELCRK